MSLTIGSRRPTAPNKRILVTSKTQLTGQLKSDVDYFIDGVIDMQDQQIVVPAGGLYMSGHNFDISRLESSVDNYDMFISPSGGSGNILTRDMAISTSGVNSKVWNIYGVTGNEAIEFEKVNFNNCTSLGNILNYRQYLEVGTGRFGGTPELTFSGTWGGARISTSIVRGISNLGALFKSGAGLVFSGRFITDINCNLPSLGNLLNFSPSNFLNDESLVIQGAYITRNFLLNPNDQDLTPNISSESVKSNWQDNSGLASTSKYIKSAITSEVLTTVAAQNTYYPLLGTFTVEKETHFDMPTNGQFRSLTGQGDYRVTGDLSVAGTANNLIDIRVTKSIDGGITFPEQVSHVRRVINNLSGARDVAFIPINFVVNLKKNDRVRLEVENKTAASNVTIELDSFFIISAL